MSEEMLEPQEAKPSKKKIIAVTAASVAGVLVLSGAGLGLYRNHQVQTLTAECESVVSTVRKGQKSLAELVKSDDVVKALKVSDKQVLDADKKTLSTLKDAVEEAQSKVTVPACEVGFFAFDANPVESVRGVLKTVQGKTSAVSDAVASVNKAVAAKTLSDAKDKLKKTVESASKLLSESDGKVQDNATRDQLKQVIDQASALLKAGKETNPAQYATKPVDDAVAAVNASMEAKRQADEKAAQAAAQAAAAQQQAYTPKNTYSGNSYSGGNSGGSSYTPPSNNSGSSGSGFDWDAWLKSHESNEQMPCQVVGTCQ